MFGCAWFGLRRLSLSVLDILTLSFSYAATTTQKTFRGTIYFITDSFFLESVYSASPLCHDSVCFGSVVDSIMTTAEYVFRHIV